MTIASDAEPGVNARSDSRHPRAVRARRRGHCRIAALLHAPATRPRPEPGPDRTRVVGDGARGRGRDAAVEPRGGHAPRDDADPGAVDARDRRVRAAPDPRGLDRLGDRGGLDPDGSGVRTGHGARRRAGARSARPEARERLRPGPTLREPRMGRCRDPVRGAVSGRGPGAPPAAVRGRPRRLRAVRPPDPRPIAPHTRTSSARAASAPSAPPSDPRPGLRLSSAGSYS